MDAYALSPDNITVITDVLLAYHPPRIHEHICVIDRDTTLYRGKKITDTDVLALLTRLPPHPHIPEFKGWVALPAGKWMVTEYLPDLTLRFAITVLQMAPVTIRKCIREIAVGMTHLHRHGVTHGSLNLDNVVFRKSANSFETVIIGFGSASTTDITDFGYLTWSALHGGAEWDASMSNLDPPIANLLSECIANTITFDTIVERLNVLAEPATRSCTVQ